jgi:hypothetical protein
MIIIIIMAPIWQFWELVGFVEARRNWEDRGQVVPTAILRSDSVEICGKG